MPVCPIRTACQVFVCVCVFVCGVGGCHCAIFTNLRMRQRCGVRILGTEGHFVFRVTLDRAEGRERRGEK